MHHATYVADRMDASSDSAWRLAVDVAKSASRAAAYAGATLLAEAVGVEGTIHLPEPTSGTWCRLAAGPLTADFLATSHGDRARMQLTQVTPEGYERVRAWVTERESCRHGEDCEICQDDPWPSYEELTSEDGDFDIVHLDESERGTAQAAFGRVTLTLDNEPVATLAKIIRLARAA
ncbi:hypothetical protein ACFYZ8_33450 [Streptomyces sp. NPDC001668]|uniref:hypothetical protein n=1 Tax=Streptomyces sp. NPDC001668 TaxID=3364598 RepID=UPI00368DDA4C